MIIVDRLMIEEYAISLEQMMENAGRSLADIAGRMLDSRVQGRRITVLCGPGNNGGGGMAAARHLHNGGARVQVVLATDAGRLKSTPRHQWAILEKIGIAHEDAHVHDADLLIDALLGYGVRGDPRPPIGGWIERLNAARGPVLSLDVPSGLDATTGAPGMPCVRAAATVALALPKTGLLVPGASEYVGDLWLADIGVPPELYRRIGLDAASPFIEAPIVRIA